MPLRQLVDEAELAVVVARADPVEQRATAPRRRAARPPAWRSSTVELEPAAADVELELGLVGQQLPLDDVARHLAVDRARSRRRTEPGALGRRAGRDGDDDGRGHGVAGYRVTAVRRAREHRVRPPSDPR